MFYPSGCPNSAWRLSYEKTNLAVAKIWSTPFPWYYYGTTTVLLGPIKAPRSLHRRLETQLWHAMTPIVASQPCAPTLEACCIALWTENRTLNQPDVAILGIDICTTSQPTRE